MSARAIDRLLFALLLTTYAFFYQGGFDNQNSRFDLALAMSFEHRLTIDSFQANTIDKVSIDGHAYSEKAPLGAYLAALAMLPAAAVLDRPEPYADALLYWVTVSVVGVLCAFAGVAFRRTLVLLNPALPLSLSALFAALTFAGTLLLPYATQLQGHAIAAAWLTLALYTGLRERLVWCSLAIGACVASEYPSVLLASAVMLVVVMRGPVTASRLARLLGPGLVFALLIGVHQWLSFGTPWSPGYGHLAGSPFADTMQHGLFGIVLPDLANAGQLLFSEYRGTFIYSPLLIAALAGIAYAPRTILVGVFAPLLAGCVALVLLISGYGYWQGGVAWGPRHLVSIIPLAALGLAFLPRRALLACAPLFACSFALNVFATATTLYVSEYDVKPLQHSYLKLLQAGEVSTSPMYALTPTASRRDHWIDAYRHRDASWNWGERVGLSGWWSLTPLLLAWVAAAIALRTNATDRAGRS